MICLFGQEACGILTPWPVPSALEGLTVVPPAKSLFSSLFILAALDLRCGERGLLFTVVCGLLIAVLLLWSSNCSAWAQLTHSTWDQTHISCVGSWILYHWTTTEVLLSILKTLCKHHYYLIPEVFHYILQRNCVPVKQSFFIPSPHPNPWHPSPAFCL